MMGRERYSYEERLEGAHETINHFKFPRIHHLFPESGRTTDDILSAEAERKHFLERFNNGEGVLTEKIDGQNIGISFKPDGSMVLRHRGGVCSPKEKIYTKAFVWAEGKRHELETLLGTDAVLLIEWLEFNRGHVVYDDLPSYAIAIALFDAREGDEGRLMSHRYISEMLENTGIAVVPTMPIDRKIATTKDALSYVGQTAYGTKGSMEGLLLRVDSDDYNNEMMKFVHPYFIASVDKSTHWMKAPLQRNEINYKKQAELLDVH